MKPIVLVADNEERSRNTFCTFFSGKGFAVVTAADGLDCLVKLRELEPDVLVVALEIPWGGGDGVVARLNEDLRLSKTVGILATGCAPVEVLSSRIGLASFNCFSRPVRARDLWDSIGVRMAMSLLRGAGTTRRENGRPLPVAEG